MESTIHKSTFLRPVYQKVSSLELVNYFLSYPEQLFIAQQINVIQWIVENIDLNSCKRRNRFLELCIKYEMIDQLIHLVEKYDLKSIKIKETTIKNTVDFLSLLKKRFETDILKEHIDIIYCESLVKQIIKSKDLSILKWLKNERKYTLHDLIYACEIGYEDAISIILKDELSDMTMDELMLMDNLSLSNVLSINDQCLQAMCKNQHFDLFLKYAEAIKINDETIAYAAYFGHEASINMLLNKYPDKSPDIFCYICASNNFDLVKKVLSEHPNIFNERCIHYGCVTNNRDLILYLLDYGRKKNLVNKSSNLFKIIYDASPEEPKYYYVETNHGLDIKDKVRYINKSVNKSLNEIKEIFYYEQRTEEWFKVREFIVTSTGVASIVGHNKHSTLEDFIKDKLDKTFLGNEKTQYGNDTEKISFMMVYLTMCYKYVYKKRYDIVNQSEVGLKIYKDHPWIGASADGICNVYDSEDNKIERITIELKSPFDKTIYKEIPHYYYDQITTAEIVSNRLKCNFCVFTPEKMQINTFIFDKVYFNLMIMPKLMDNYFNEILPKIILRVNEITSKGHIYPAIVLDE